MVFLFHDVGPFIIRKSFVCKFQISFSIYIKPIWDLTMGNSE